MLLKYMNKGMELVRTKEGKKEIKQGEVFDTFDNIGESLMRNYKGMFEKVEENKGSNGEEEKNKEDKKGEWKKVKAKK